MEKMKTEIKKEKINTIDLTPTWQTALMIYMNAFEKGGSKGRDSAIEGLKQMADVAQSYAEMFHNKRLICINAKLYSVDKDAVEAIEKANANHESLFVKDALTDIEENNEYICETNWYTC